MEPNDFIKRAIDQGEQLGLLALNGTEQVVYALAETETYCDMKGIDSLLARYGKGSMNLFAQAFLEVGASEVAAALHVIANGPDDPSDASLSHANRLITERRGYSHDDVENRVARGR